MQLVASVLQVVKTAWSVLMAAEIAWRSSVAECIALVFASWRAARFAAWAVASSVALVVATCVAIVFASN